MIFSFCLFLFRFWRREDEEEFESNKSTTTFFSLGLSNRISIVPTMARFVLALAALYLLAVPTFAFKCNEVRRDRNWLGSFLGKTEASIDRRTSDPAGLVRFFFLRLPFF